MNRMEINQRNHSGRRTAGRSFSKARRGQHFRMILFLFLVLAAAGCFLAVRPAKCEVSAAESSGAETDTRYVMYVVQAGDTLWDIADSRLTESFPTCRAYAREVMRANCMEDSRIYPGDLLMIPEDVIHDADTVTYASNP